MDEKYITSKQNIRRGMVYTVQFSIDKKYTYLGTFDTLEEAIEVRDKALAERPKTKRKKYKPQTKYPDLTGMAFGRLLVIEKSKQRVNNKPSWHCRCTCGNEKIVSTYNLWNGAVVSCGCKGAITKENAPKLERNVFGRLTVIKASEQRIRGQFSWDCQCSCGNKIVVPNRQLLSGITKSCGCLPHGYKPKEESTQVFSKTQYPGIYKRVGKRKTSYKATAKGKDMGMFKTLEEAAQAREDFIKGGHNNE